MDGWSLPKFTMCGKAFHLRNKNRAEGPRCHQNTRESGLIAFENGAEKAVCLVNVRPQAEALARVELRPEAAQDVPAWNGRELWMLFSERVGDPLVFLG